MLPLNFRSLHGLGLKFIPRPSYTNSQIIENTIKRFQKDLYNCCIYAGGDDKYDLYLYAPSNQEPTKKLVPLKLQWRINMFASTLCMLYMKKRSPSNLLPHQQHCLDLLTNSPNLVICHTDKNLGPAIMEWRHYLCMTFIQHLQDKHTYNGLTQKHADQLITDSHKCFTQWLRKYWKEISKSEATYLKWTCILIHYPQLYLLAKIHKSPLATRPIMSISGSPLHRLACWANQQLQPVARTIPSYIKSSFDLVKDIQATQTKTPFPPTVLLFTCDTVAMYTYIDTEDALSKIQLLVKEHVSAALKLIMTWNIFQFSDTWWHQTAGTTMGTPPACMWATLYFAPQEQILCNHYQEYLLY